MKEQIKNLVKQGLSLREACEAVGLDYEGAGGEVILSQEDRIVTIGEMLKDFRPRALSVLMEIAERGENESARVKAASVIFTGQGEIEIDSSLNAIAENYKKMREALEKHLPKPANVIDISNVDDKQASKCQ